MTCSPAYFRPAAAGVELLNGPDASPSGRILNPKVYAPTTPTVKEPVRPGATGWTWQD